MTAMPDVSAAALVALDGVLPRLVASVEVAEVLSSAVELCVPSFSDACTVEIFDHDRAVYRLAIPRDTEISAPAGRVATPFEKSPNDPCPAYRGELIHIWHGRTATPADVAAARVLADFAVGVLTTERLAARNQQAELKVKNLEIALARSREIGSAIGILMASHKITDSAALELLRAVSQRSNRKLRDIAMEVLELGCLEQA